MSLSSSFRKEEKTSKEMSRVRKVLDACSSGNGNEESSGNVGFNEESNILDHEISQLTRMRTTPHEHLSRLLPGKGKLPVSPVKMLVGREGNYSGRGRFSSSDCCHVLSRYLPIYGPSVIDSMKSCAYVSQFSEDGSLFVAGFQV